MLLSNFIMVPILQIIMPMDLSPAVITMIAIVVGSAFPTIAYVGVILYNLGKYLQRAKPQMGFPSILSE